ncbi:MAG: hypothetical protein GY947_08425, partial [Rhodobacteraceae bacterium]|nr:hypothetical protein [Paracoccaceae bacterium]
MINVLIGLIRTTITCALLVLAQPAHSESWRYLPPEESGSQPGWHGAVLEAGSRFVTMVFSPDAKSWYATFGIPLEKNPDTITSRIVDSDGSAMVLKLASDKFSTNYLESTGLTLMTFSIS